MTTIPSLPFDGQQLRDTLVALDQAIEQIELTPGEDGTDGREVELQATATHIQWRYVGAPSWANLIALSVITGPPGGSGSGSGFGGYAVNNYIVPTTGALATGQAITANQIALMPFMVERAITPSELVTRVTTAASGSEFQLAIYGSVNGLHSGNPIFSTAPLSAGTAGLIQAAMAVTLQPDVLYWQAINSNGTPTFLSVAANNSYHSSIVGAGTLSEVLSSTGTSFHCRIVTGQTYGTWPDLTGVSSVVPTSNQRRVPVFAFLINALP
jgi:hypothetical protein